MKKILLCINPKAGAGKSKSRLFDIVNALNSMDCEVTVYTIVPGQRSVEDILATHRDGYDVYACCGGDGTLNRFINACKAQEITHPIGYYPLGSTNDFARTIWKKPSLTNISRSIAQGSGFHYDLGNFNGRYFNYIAAFGAFTDVSYSTEQRFKDALGYLAYVLNGLTNLPQNLNQNIALRYTVDGVEHEGNYIFGSVSNTTSIGGFTSPLMRQVKLNDGLFEVILIKAPLRVYELGELAAALSKGNVNDRCIEVFQTDHIDFHFTEPVRWTLDGEESTPESEVSIHVEPDAMCLMV